MEAAQVEAGALATIGRRFVARLIDALIVALPASLALWPYIDADEGTIDGPLWLVYLLGLVVPAMYEIVFIAWRGQTVGKVIMSVRVVQLDGGEVPSASQSAIRALLPLAVLNLPLPPISTLAGMAIYLWAFTSPLRQGLHDRAAGTVVVSTS